MTSITYNEGAHLVRRMTFGAPPEEINSLAQRGREGAVDHLINYESIDSSAMEALLARSYPKPDGGSATAPWWVSRMAVSRRQFEEKMTLFWHNHFATGVSKVDSYAPMYLQNLTLRESALGRFANYLISNRSTGSNTTGAWLADDRLRSYVDESPQKTVENFLTVLGPLNVSPETLNALVDFKRERIARHGSWNGRANVHHRQSGAWRAVRRATFAGANRP